MKKPNGAIIYDGPSLIDGAPIVVIVTGLNGRSRNSKTGHMVQTWILRSDIAPLAAIKSGDDASICGGCKHRGHNGRKRTCYVNVGQAPTVVFKTYLRSGYPRMTTYEVANLIAGMIVRLGSYGDPAAAPFAIWRNLVAHAKAHTGYTHQWADCDPAYAELLMASADSMAEQVRAKLRGYRVFRVRAESEPTLPREVVCPASAEAGFRTTCSLCRACGGLASKAKADIAIMPHGSGKVYFQSL